eukprot:3890453-Prymnesium_polylepis.1
MKPNAPWADAHGICTRRCTRVERNNNQHSSNAAGAFSTDAAQYTPVQPLPSRPHPHPHLTTAKSGQLPAPASAARSAFKLRVLMPHHEKRVTGGADPQTAHRQLGAAAAARCTRPRLRRGPYPPPRPRLRRRRHHQ